MYRFPLRCVLHDALALLAMAVPSLVSSNSILVRFRCALALAMVAWLSCGRSAGQDDSKAPPTAESVLAQLQSPDPSEVLRGLRDAREFAAHDAILARTMLHLIDDERMISDGPFVQRIVWFEAAIAFDPHSETGLEVLKQYLENDPPPNIAERLIYYVLNHAPPDAKLYDFVAPHFQSLDEHLRCAAIQASGNLAIDQAVWLRDMKDPLSDSDVHVRGAVIDALMEQPEQAALLLDRLIEMLYEPGDVYVAISLHAATTCPLRRRVAKLLCSMGMAAGPALDDLRVVWAMDEDMETRVWSAVAIARMTEPPDPYTIEFLGQRLQREDSRARFELVEAMGQLSPDTPGLIACVGRAIRSAPYRVRRRLASLIFELGLESQPGWCESLLEDRHPEVVADSLETMLENRYHFGGLAQQLASIATREWPKEFDAYYGYRATESALEAIDSMGAQASLAKSILQRWAEEHSDEQSETSVQIREWLQRE